MHKVVDNFFEDPYRVRQIGLDLLAEEYNCILNDSIENYPGIRCSVPSNISSYIINFLEKTLTTNIANFSCAFHITSGIHRLGLIHRDKLKYAGLVYLNENPVEHSGTILCTPIANINVLEQKNDFPIASSTHDIKIITEFADYKEEYNKNFNIKLELTNKFNRIVLYEGTHYHAPYYYFGNNLFNSRLVLVFWFDLV